jgi:hypothetical protein
MTQNKGVKTELFMVECGRHQPTTFLYIDIFEM